MRPRVETRRRGVDAHGMSEEPANLILSHLRASGAEVQTMAVDVAEIKTRTGRLEIGLAQTQVSVAEQSIRSHRMDERLKRIERRLDL